VIRTQEEYLHRLGELSGDVQAVVLEFAAYFTHIQTSTALALLRRNKDVQIGALKVLLAQQQDIIERLVREREVGDL
jgi:hypothetical protein